ncbi:immunity to superinfection [Escherichia phage vB_EcoM_VR25]|uniref:Immunity to superinfection membrane protein n=1 Tax=Escherichia phage vB_EcoM_VR25 TaxID=1567028 RepID=A0A0A7HCK5_9CAUD|nr:immunity to superinfection [Escherichia phage vB_EcoM_VR25]AIZ02393.1 immunity to superinfection membrane protein [Escherichia phage vB_EcoM_VR25]
MEALIVGAGVFGFGSLVVMFIGYFLPWIIALLRGTRSNVGIFFINLLFGWTMIGWVIALIWAIVAERKTNAQIIVVKQ